MQKSEIITQCKAKLSLLSSIYWKRQRRSPNKHRLFLQYQIVGRKTFLSINESIVIFSIYDFFAEGKKSKYRWFKVVRFGGGGGWEVGGGCSRGHGRGITKEFDYNKFRKTVVAM